MITSNEKSSAMLIHLSTFAKYIIPFGSILVPLIIWQATKKDDDFIDYHGKEAVNFNLSFFLYNIIAILVIFGSIIGTIVSSIQLDNSESLGDLSGILLSTGSFITALVVLSTISIIKLILIIIAAIKANQGDLYRYPLTIRFIK